MSICMGSLYNMSLSSRCINITLKIDGHCDDNMLLPHLRLAVLLLPCTHGIDIKQHVSVPNFIATDSQRFVVHNLYKGTIRDSN